MIAIPDPILGHTGIDYVVAVGARLELLPARSGMAPKGRRAKAQASGELGFKAQPAPSPSQPDGPQAAGGDSGAGPEELSMILYSMYVLSQIGYYVCIGIHDVGIFDVGITDMGIYICMQEPPQKRRRQLGRRDSEETINRAIEKHFGHLPQEIVETFRIDGLLIRDIVKRDRAALPAGGRLGASYWVTLASQISRSTGGLDSLRPADKEKCMISCNLCLVILDAVS